MWGIGLLQRRFVSLFLFVWTSLAGAQAPSAPGRPLPPGPLQAKVKATCTQCHNTARITEKRLTRQQWSDELDKMEGLGAVIPESDRGAILAYLAKNLGPVKGAAKSASAKGAEGK
jgi:hypothetical protein